MTISGYTFVRNATKLSYPLKESITSIIDLVDEFVIVYVQGDEDDDTLAVIKSIETDKIKLINACWIPEKFEQNTLFSYLSDIGKESCKGDWLFYLQVDEVVHEKYIEVIRGACKRFLENLEVEGFLFNYRHFWGDYSHYFTHHGWYPKEIRIIRNLKNIHSWKDAQSFRYYSKFSPTTAFYQSKKDTRKLNVVEITAEIYHYGWVRPPYIMAEKREVMEKTWNTSKKEIEKEEYDYGLLNRVPVFTHTHPSVMIERVAAIDWHKKLKYTKGKEIKRPLFKHEKLRYRIKSWIEINLLRGREIGGFKNYKIINKLN